MLHPVVRVSVDLLYVGQASKCVLVCIAKVSMLFLTSTYFVGIILWVVKYRYVGVLPYALDRRWVVSRDLVAIDPFSLNWMFESCMR